MITVNIIGVAVVRQELLIYLDIKAVKRRIFDSYIADLFRHQLDSRNEV